MMDAALLGPLLRGIAWLLFGIFLLILAMLASAIHAYLTLAFVLLACGAALQGLVFTRAAPTDSARRR